LESSIHHEQPLFFIRTFIASVNDVNILCGGGCVMAVVMAEDFCHFAQGLL
jgi:hypothetical protein